MKKNLNQKLINLIEYYNLINTNLEAISANACMIIPKPKSDRFIDIETYKLLGNSVNYYEVNNIKDLKSKILFLLQNPNKINEYKNKLSYYKRKK